MNRPTGHQYEFGEFCLDPSRRVLLHAGESVPLTPKEFDTLVILVSSGGSLVEKGELLKAIWPETFVGEATLAQNVSTLRKALRLRQPDHKYIETVSKYGYRFVADVRELREPDIILEKRTVTHIVAEEIEDAGFESDPQADASPRHDSSANLSHSETHLNGHESTNQSVGFSNIATRQPSAVTITAIAKRHRTAIALALAAALTIAAIFYFTLRRANPSDASFQKMHFSMLTTSGRALRTAISPDGNSVATILAEGGLQSLWLRQVVGSRNLQIVAPAAVRYQGITFSPDNNFIYYIAYEKDELVGVLYQVPTLGGTPNKVLSDIDSAVSFSSDGKNIAFVRENPVGKESYLMIANANGTQERKVATRTAPDFFSVEGAAWSPDNQRIICAVGRNEFNYVKMDVVEYRVADGTARLLTTHQWDAIGQLAWLADGSAIVMDAWDSAASLLSKQIWKLSYPGGETTRITNDLNSYHGVSLAKNNSALVTVRVTRASSLWVAPSEEINRATRITSGAGDLVGEVMGLCWTPGGHLVYGSNASGGLDVWSMDADGSNQRQLTVDARADIKPSVSPDGRFIVFVSWRTGIAHIWRMDPDGTNLKQLTDGAAESYPNISPDGRWVVYLSAEQNKSHVWKIPADGGNPVEVTSGWSMFPRISPDGKVIACFYADGPNENFKLALIPFAGGAPIKRYPVPPTVFLRGGVHWKADGSALTYVDNGGGVSNIWSQPVDGSPAKQLTNFTSDKIFRFAWSLDGQRLAFERGMEISDTTLIGDFK